MRPSWPASVKHSHALLSTGLLQSPVLIRCTTDQLFGLVVSSRSQSFLPRQRGIPISNHYNTVGQDLKFWAVLSPLGLLDCII